MEVIVWIFSSLSLQIVVTTCTATSIQKSWKQSKQQFLMLEIDFFIYQGEWDNIQRLRTHLKLTSHNTHESLVCFVMNLLVTY